MKKIKKGFTLVELLVVIAIIAILAAIIAPNAFKAIEKSKVATAEADYRAIKTATLSYYSDTGKWPTNTTGGTELAASTGILGFNGPYLEKWPTKNPWGGSYTYNTTEVSSVIPGANFKYITLTEVPSAAITRLEADLDGDSTGTTGTVRYASATATTVYLIISEQ